MKQLLFSLEIAISQKVPRLVVSSILGSVSVAAFGCWFRGGANLVPRFAVLGGACVSCWHGCVKVASVLERRTMSKWTWACGIGVLQIFIIARHAIRGLFRGIFSYTPNNGTPLPDYSHTTQVRISKDIGMGVPGITLDLCWRSCFCFIGDKLPRLQRSPWSTILVRFFSYSCLLLCFSICFVFLTLFCSCFLFFFC